MIPLKEQISELLELTKLYLLQEYKKEDRLHANSENYHYFKKLASIKKKEVKPSISSFSPVPPVLNTDISKPANKPISQIAPAKKEEIKPPQTLISESVPLMKEEIKVPDPVSPKTEFFKFETLQPPKPTDFSEIRNLIKEHAPGLKIIDKIPSSFLPPKAEILILSIPCSPTGQSLLNNMNQAINQHIAPASFIDASSFKLTEEWITFFNGYTLKLIVIPQADLDELPALKILFKNNEKGQPFLHNIPTLLIPKPEALHQQPALKQDVWNSLKSYSKPKIR